MSLADVTIELLRPTTKQQIMDAVANAGIDVSGWARRADGGAVKNPAANPKYCYEWAFGGGDEPTVLCVWHENLEEDSGTVFYSDNMRVLAIDLEAIASDWRTESEVRNRAVAQADRARTFDLLLQRAYRKKTNVRLVLLTGLQRDRKQLGIDASQVKFRELDSAEWIVESYDDESGAFRVVRRRDSGPDNALPSPDLAQAYQRVAMVTVDAFADAFADIDAALTSPQREMLVGHALAHGRTLSMERIAVFGGYHSHATANLQYGALGRKIADALQIDGLANQVQSFCELANEKDDQGHEQWIMREAAFRALVDLGMVPTTSEASDTFVAALMEAGDIAAEPKTTRRAMVDARLGQGAYRRKMLRFWGGACAVTGCAVEPALVASHAVPWKDCSPRERLDHFNGLILTGTLDRLFDAGLIGFSDDGALLISGRLKLVDREVLGLVAGQRLRHLDERLVPYLGRHRALHGL